MLVFCAAAFVVETVQVGNDISEGLEAVLNEIATSLLPGTGLSDEIYDPTGYNPGHSYTS